MSFDTNIQKEPACMIISALTNYIFVKGSDITKDNFNTIITYGTRIYKKYIGKIKNDNHSNYLSYTDLDKIFSNDFPDLKSYTEFPKSEIEQTHHYKIIKNLDEFILYIRTIINANKYNTGRIGLLILCSIYAISIMFDFSKLQNGTPYIFIRDSHRQVQNDFYDDDGSGYGVLKILLTKDVPNECFGENKQINLLSFTTKDICLPKFNFELDKILYSNNSNAEMNHICEYVKELFSMYKNLNNDDKKIWNTIAISYLESKKIKKNLINEILLTFNKNLSKITVIPNTNSNDRKRRLFP